MTDGQVFARSRPWQGWLILAGGLPAFHLEAPSVADRLLQKAATSPCAVWIDAEVTLNAGVERMIDEIEPFLSSPIERLGPEEKAPDVDLEAGLILMVGNDLNRWLQSIGSTPTGLWALRRLDEGSAVFACGAAAAVLGERAFSPVADDRGCEGVGWLPGAVVLPGTPDPAHQPQVKRYLSETDRSYALGLLDETVMAIGPQGQIEVWSGAPPKVVLGRGWITG